MEDDLAVSVEMLDAYALWPAIPLLSICPTEICSQWWHNVCRKLFIAVLSVMAKLWKQSKCPLEEREIKPLPCKVTEQFKELCECVYTEIQSVLWH